MKHLIYVLIFLFMNSFAFASNININGMFVTGCNYISEKKTDLAYDIFTNLLNIEPNNPKYNFYMAKCLILQSNYDKAIDFLEKASSLGYKNNKETITILNSLYQKLDFKSINK